MAEADGRILGPRVTAEKFKQILDMLETRRFGFADAVMISGIDGRQLRNGLDRGTLAIGVKMDSIGRWAFSGLDCIEMMIIDQLSRNIQMPVGLAGDIARKMAPLASTLIKDVIAQAEKAGPEARIEPTGIEAHVGFGRGDPTVYVERVGHKAGIYDLVGEPADKSYREGAYIVIPISGLIHDLFRRFTLLGQ